MRSMSVNPTILVADNEPLHRDLIDMLLSPDDYQLVMFGDGRQVLEYLRHNTPEATILAADLPLVSGADICSKMKSIKRLAQVPVVLTLPPHDNLDQDDKTLEFAKFVKADLMLHKPLGDKNVRERLSRLLSPQDDTASENPTGDTQVIEETLRKLEGAEI